MSNPYESPEAMTTNAGDWVAQTHMNSNTAATAIETFFLSERYRLEDGHPHDGVYGIGNNLMRILRQTIQIQSPDCGGRIRKRCHHRKRDVWCNGRRDRLRKDEKGTREDSSRSTTGSQLVTCIETQTTDPKTVTCLNPIPFNEAVLASRNFRIEPVFCAYDSENRATMSHNAPSC